MHRKTTRFKNTVHLIVKDPVKSFDEYSVDAIPFETGSRGRQLILNSQ